MIMDNFINAKSIKEIIENKSFENIDWSENNLPKAEYDKCDFAGCNFSYSDLTDITFMECAFDNCNFSMAKMNNSSLKDVKFVKCKILGVNFKDCKDFLLSMDFEDSHLNLSSFFKLQLKGIKFRNCSLQEVDFTKADLTSALFDHCDLGKAVFENTILENVDFRTSHNYFINPEINKMKGAKFSRSGINGLLGKYDIEVE